MSTKNEVQAASQRFYAALGSMARGDAPPVKDVWSHGAGVSTMHPPGGREIGWGQVAIEQRVTDVIRRKGGDWKPVHHHANVSSKRIEILARLRAKG